MDPRVTSTPPSFLSDPNCTDSLYYHQLIDHITSQVHNQLSRNHNSHLEYIHAG